MPEFLTLEWFALAITASLMWGCAVGIIVGMIAIILDK